MPTYDLPVPNKILIESSKSVSFRTIKAAFGDGYSQRAPDGINSKVSTWNIKWGGLTLTELTEIEGVLDSAGGSSVILWTPCNETVEKKFINKEASYTRTRVGNIYEITTALEEVFDAS